MTYHKQNLSVPVHNRLKRMKGDMPEGIACTFDEVKNLLCINSQIWLSLDQKRQERLWRATKTMTVMEARV